MPREARACGFSGNNESSVGGAFKNSLNLMVWGASEVVHSETLTIWVPVQVPAPFKRSESKETDSEMDAWC